MSRQRFGRWGAELSEKEFACALVRIGATVYSDHRAYFDLVPALVESPYLRAKEAAGGWMRSGLTDLAVEVIARQTRLAGIDPQWLVETLLRAPGVTSVGLIDDPLLVRRRWDWPIDCGFIDTPAGNALKDSFAGHHFPGFARHVNAERARAQLDLLFFPGTLPEAVAWFASAPIQVEVHTVLVCGGRGKSRDVVTGLAHVRAETRAAVVGLVELRDDRAGWLSDLLYQLSHNKALDEALFLVSATPPLLLAEPDVLDATRTSEAAVDIARRLAETDGTADLISPTLRDRVGAEPDTSLSDLAERITHSAKAFDWSREVEAATDTLQMSEVVRDRTPRRDVRFVQGQLRANGVLLGDHPLIPSVIHDLAVFVGRPRQGWSRSYVPLPEQQLRDHAGYTLTVVFVAPGVLDEPQQAELWLPAHGDSKEVLFHFAPSDKIRRLDGRITILYENRVLQTLRISADVGSRSDGPAVEMHLETVHRADLRNLAGSPGFDAAFFLNDLDDKPGITAFGASTAFVRLDSVRPLLLSLRGELEKITKEPDDYADIHSEESRVLLVTLARAGSAFGDGLRELPGMRKALAGLGERSARLQVTSIHPDDLIPLEFIYDAPFPKATALLCECVREPAATERCKADENIVCPQGFWGMRHVVERRMYNENDTEVLQRRGADYALGPEAGQDRPCLDLVRSVLLGTANKASSFDAPTFDRDIGAIGGALANAAARLVRADSWASWVEQVQKERPELLVLVTHTESELGACVLELGKDDHLAAPQIKAPHVSAPPPTPPKPGPVVFLLGCRTATEEVPFSSFIGKFRQAHASVVLATLSTVRGRHMAPLAREAVDLLLECQKRTSCSVGEYVRDLRFRALNKNLLVGLALVAYGEADWHIGSST